MEKTTQDFRVFLSEMTAQNQAFVAGDSKLSKNLKFADICHQSYWSHQNK